MQKVSIRFMAVALAALAVSFVFIVGSSMALPRTSAAVWTAGAQESGQDDLGGALTAQDDAAPVITTTTLPEAPVGKAYSATLVATGTPQPTWSVSSGTLPDGLTLDATTGAISGTPTTANTKANPYTTFTVTASNGISPDATQEFEFIVSSPPISYLSPGYICMLLGKPFTYDAGALTGGYPIPTFKLGADARGNVEKLPDGLTLDPATGIISGTPTTVCSPVVILDYSNSAGSGYFNGLGLFVEAQPEITPDSLPNAELDIEYRQQLWGGGTLADKRWSVSSGSLPPGITLDGDPNVASNGLLIGAPTKVGTYTFTMTASNDVASDSKEYTIEVDQKPSIETSTLQATVGTAYSATLQVTGYPKPSLTMGSILPAGLFFDASTGTISGTPRKSGTFPLAITATNSMGTYSAAITLDVDEAPAITTTSLPTAREGRSYSTTLSATGYPAATWSIVSGTLPAGLTLDASTGTISGTPTDEPGTISTFTVQADNGTKPAATKEFSIAIGQSMITIWTRLAGANRIETAGMLVDTGFSGDHACKAIVLATAWGYADSLSASTLSGLLDAPLVTTDTETLSSITADEIERLASSDGCTVYVLGDANAVSDAAVDQVKAISGVTDVKRISGASRVATNLAVYQTELALQNVSSSLSDTVIVTNAWGYADALAASPYACASKTPILVTQSTGGALAPDTAALVKQYIDAGWIRHVVVLGDSNAVSLDGVEAQLGSGVDYLNLAGTNRYGTCQQIIAWETGAMPQAGFQPAVTLGYDGMAAANAWAYADALASVNVLGRTDSVLLLVGDDDTTQAMIGNVVGSKASSIRGGYVLGGTNAVDENVEGWLKAATS